MNTVNSSTGNSAVGMDSFISLPKAFPGASEDIVHSLKFQFQALVVGDGKSAPEFEVAFNPSSVLIDFDALGPNFLDTDKLVRDCEIIRDAALKNPEKLKSIVSTFTSKGASISQLNEAYGLLKELELLEEQVTKKGGGFLILLIILVVCASGCAHCTQGGTFPPVQHPKQP